MKAKTAKICEVLPQLDGTIFERKLDDAMSEAGKRVITHGKQAKVIIELTFKKISENGNQVMVAHKMKSDLPTSKGKIVEEDTTETPLFVGANGGLSTSPGKQEELFKNEKLRKVN